MISKTRGISISQGFTDYLAIPGHRPASWFYFSSPCIRDTVSLIKDLIHHEEPQFVQSWSKSRESKKFKKRTNYQEKGSHGMVVSVQNQFKQEHENVPLKQAATKAGINCRVRSKLFATMLACSERSPPQGLCYIYYVT